MTPGVVTDGDVVSDAIVYVAFAELVPATPKQVAHPFQDYLAYLEASNALVEKCYQLEKQAGFDGAGTVESREFLKQRLAAGAEMLRNLWYTAWLTSGQDPPPWVPNKPAEQPANTPPPNMHTAPKLGEAPPSLVG